MPTGPWFQGVKTIVGKKYYAYGRSAEQCARNLNFICKKKLGCELPNPELGVPSRIRGLKKKRKRNLPKNVNRKGGKYFYGEKRHKGERVCVSAESAEMCAHKLNVICVQKGWETPNPDIEEPLDPVMKDWMDVEVMNLKPVMLMES